MKCPTCGYHKFVREPNEIRCGRCELIINEDELKKNVVVRDDDDYVRFVNGGGRTAIHIDQNNEEYFYIQNPYGEEELCADNISLSIEAVKDGYADTINFSKYGVFGSFVSSAVKFLDINYGRSVRDKMLKTLDNVIVKYNVVLSIKNGYLREHILSKTYGFYDLRNEDQSIFNTKEEAKEFVKEFKQEVIKKSSLEDKTNLPIGIKRALMFNELTAGKYTLNIVEIATFKEDE